MSYILITNSDVVSLRLVHADNEGDYLAHNGVKGQRLGVRRFQNPDVSLTEKEKRRMKTLQGKSDKLYAKKAKLNSSKNMVKLSKYKSLSADRHAIDRKKIKVGSKLNPLKEIDAEYARSLAEKVDKRKDKK